MIAMSADNGPAVTEWNANTANPHGGVMTEGKVLVGNVDTSRIAS